MVLDVHSPDTKNGGFQLGLNWKFAFNGDFTAMRKVNIDQVESMGRKSPKGKYQAQMKMVSTALGRDRDSMDLTKRHPFDLALVRIPPGAALCPYHSHSAQWEMYVVVSGRGAVREESGESEVAPGDAFLFPPGEAHQLSNRGEEDFVYYVIADNPVGESCHYPDSGKWAVYKGPDMVIVKGQETEYLDGEE